MPDWLSEFVESIQSLFKGLMPKSFEELYETGLEQFEDNDIENALATFLQCQKKNPHCAPVYYNLGSLYEAMKDNENARKAYEYGHQLSPRDTDILYALANLLYKQDKLDAAQEYIEQAVNQFTEDDEVDVDIAILAGYIYDQQSLPAKAIEQYERALSVEPEHIYARIFITKAYIGKQDAESAEKHLPKPDDVDRKNLELNYELSLCMAKLSHWEETVTCCERVIELDPNFPKAYNQLGLAKYCMQVYDEAVLNYRTALSLDPNYATALNNLAYTYEKMEAWQSAIDHFNQYLKFVSNPREKIEVTHHIDVLKQKLITANKDNSKPEDAPAVAEEAEAVAPLEPDAPPEDKVESTNSRPEPEPEHTNEPPHDASEDEPSPDESTPQAAESASA